MRILLAVLMIFICANSYAITWTKDWSAADNGVTTFGGQDFKNMQDDIGSQVLLTTGDYTLSGANTYSGSNTFSGTTSIATINQQTSQWTMNGDVYSTPTRTHIGYFTKAQGDGDGTQTISGMDFTPKGVIFLAGQSNTTETSWGIDNYLARGSTIDNDSGTEDTYQITQDQSICMFESGSADAYVGKITSVSNGSFTITWDDVHGNGQAGDIEVYYLAFGV